MDTAEQPTCGKGLAENSVFPAKLGNLISAMAENLAIHTLALDQTDPNSRVEYDAYEKLIAELRQSAAALQVTASEMAGYRDLPMGRHDPVAMTQPEVRTAFEHYVKSKKELLSLLQETAERDDQLLAMMRAQIP